MRIQELRRLWRTLEKVPVLAGVESSWRGWLGSDFDAARSFLTSEVNLATTYPCPQPAHDRCPRQVVVHGDEDIVAVCGNSPARCDRLQLSRSDLVILAFDFPGLGRRLAVILQLDDRGGSAVPEVPGIYALGSLHVPPARGVPVFLVDPTDGQLSIELLLVQRSTPFVLVTPTSALPTGLTPALVARGCQILACADFVGWTTKAGLCARYDVDEVLAPLRTGFAKAAGAQGGWAGKVGDVAPSFAIVFTHEDIVARAVSKREYESILADRDLYDLLVDGVVTSHVARRRHGNTFHEVHLTAKEFEVLRRYLNHRAVDRGTLPATRVGVTKQSEDAARKLFDRMRSKVDFRVKGQQYRVFKQSRHFEGGPARYAFAPDADLRFCIIAPLQA